MATLATTAVTLADWAKRLDPDGSTAAIVEILAESNEVIDFMLWKEGNLPTGHRTTIRSGLPTGTWRMLNYGVQPEKSTTVQVDDVCGMLESFGQTDQALANLNGNTAEFRLSEERAFVEGMTQTFATTLMYGNVDTNPERFTGFSPRYNDTTTAENKANIISGAGSGSDNRSVWLITWADDCTHGIFPKGSMAGLKVDDLGLDTVQDTQTPAGLYRAFRTHYKWDCGLTVRDWRYNVRIANIDVSDLTKDAASGADLIDLMVQAVELLPSRKGTLTWLVSRDVRSYLRRQITNKSNVWLNMDEVAGKKVMTFDDIPVLRMDALGVDEATVS